MIREPTQEELVELERECAAMPAQEADNWRFWRLFNYENGLVCREVPTYEHEDPKNPHSRLRKYEIAGKVHLKQVGTKRLPLPRRQFIERYLRVRNIDATITKFILNPVQRAREARIVRQERLGLPVRQVDLKGRQLGITTHSIGISVDATLRRSRQRAVVVSQDEETAAAALDISTVMFDELPRAKGRWRFAWSSEQTTFKTLDAPQHSGLRIASARKTNPGRGLTYSVGIYDESAFWEAAPKKIASLSSGLPNRPGTIGLLFSTANGAQGVFYQAFTEAWQARAEPLEDRAGQWHANFWPWYMMPGYRWTESMGAGRALPDKTRDWIINTLTEHERELLDRTYFRRWKPDDPWVFDAPPGGGKPRWRRVGVGMRRVDVDQLAWRRQMIAKHQGDPLRPESWAMFQAEYPSTPEEAFIATGRVVFDQGALMALSKLASWSHWSGDILDLTDPANRQQPMIPGGAFTREQLGVAPGTPEAPQVFKRHQPDAAPKLEAADA